jgi:hypothetical protein
MRNILNLTRTNAWLAIGLSIIISFSVLVLEFGSTSVRSGVCRIVYPDTPQTYLADEFLHYTNASTLIAQVLAMREGRSVPSSISSGKIIHQSWKNHEVPTSYHPLMSSWRSTYPGWSYVLWDDDDNLELVETFFPEWRNAYNGLPSNIYRADFARNLYMYVNHFCYAFTYLLGRFEVYFWRDICGPRLRICSST